ncbi:MAG TPA: class II glutamine amidotransferase [Thermoanaerobaculaceae bacterium]|nr:class II glutamine amidotransferase [Thermoanaerobaculaceae bacterium]
MAFRGVSEATDKFRDECGVCAVLGRPDAANLVYLGLYALQHRGQESAGIAAFDGKELRHRKEMGYVADIFDRSLLDELPGFAAVGHVRYSTAGNSSLINAQPMVAKTHRGQVALAHNGNLVNALRLRRELEKAGAIFQSTSDSEVFLHVLARSQAGTLEAALLETLDAAVGAYSVVVLCDGRLFAARDPHGFRPLALGRLDETWVVASETCAFDLIEARMVREVGPGEVVELSGEEPRVLRRPRPGPYAHCVFEHVYFARPDSRVFGEDVGAVLLVQHPVVAREAGGAEVPGRGRQTREHALLGEVAKGVGADEGPDLLDALTGSDQLAPLRGVDAVEAGPDRRRRGDPEVHLRGAHTLEHHHDLA